MAGRNARQRMTKRAGLLCAAGALFAAAGPATGQLPCSYTVTVLPDVNCGILGYSPGNPSAMNNLGHAVVWGACSLSGYADSWLWTGGTNLILIPKAPGMLGFHATDINDNDVIVGEAEFATTGKRAVIYDHGTWTYLPPLNPPWGWSSANAINNSNQVCGYRSIGNPGDPVNPYQAFIWSASTGFNDLGVMNGPRSSATDISDSGIVVGWTGSGSSVSGDRAFVYAGGITTILPQIPGGVSSKGAYTNNQGTVVGTGNILIADPPGYRVRAFATSHGQMQVIAPPSGYVHTLVLGVSGQNVVAGLSRPSTGSDVAFLWWQGTMIDPLTLIPNSGLSSITGISDLTENGFGLGIGRTTANVLATFRLTPIGINAADINHDCRTDVSDLLAVINAWGTSNAIADINNDGAVDIQDLLAVINNWSG